jgi:hypothetical protein
MYFAQIISGSVITRVYCIQTYTHTHTHTHTSRSNIKITLHFSHGVCLSASYLYLRIHNDNYIKNINQFVFAMETQCVFWGKNWIFIHLNLDLRRIKCIKIVNAFSWKFRCPRVSHYRSTAGVTQRSHLWRFVRHATVQNQLQVIYCPRVLGAFWNLILRPGMKWNAWGTFSNPAGASLTAPCYLTCHQSVALAFVYTNNSPVISWKATVVFIHINIRFAGVLSIYLHLQQQSPTANLVANYGVAQSV